MSLNLVLRRPRQHSFLVACSSVLLPPSTRCTAGAPSNPDLAQDLEATEKVTTRAIAVRRYPLSPRSHVLSHHSFEKRQRSSVSANNVLDSSSPSVIHFLGSSLIGRCHNSDTLTIGSYWSVDTTAPPAPWLLKKAEIFLFAA